MRKPDHIKCLYIDFDAFFANVERELEPAIRSRPVGVTSLDSPNATLITRCYAAKAAGISRGMRATEARAICPDLVIRPARHEIYVRTHNKILEIIGQHLPVTKVWSIDEMECRLMGQERFRAAEIACKIRQSLRTDIGACITPSMGLAANQFLAKVAAEMEKPKGLVTLAPEDLPERLMGLDLSDLPGIAKGIRSRLEKAGITSVMDLWNTPPKQARQIWGNVEGERFWAQLRGYEVERPATQRRMFGHSRVLHSDWQTPPKAFDCMRLLTVKAAYRMRREGYTAAGLSVTLRHNDGRWSAEVKFPACSDDRTLCSHMKNLFKDGVNTLGRHYRTRSPRLKGVYVMLHDIVPVGARSGDLFDDPSTVGDMQKWAKVTSTMDALNERHKSCVVHLGTRAKLPGGYAGAKIAFGRVPDENDFI